MISGVFKRIPSGDDIRTMGETLAQQFGDLRDSKNTTVESSVALAAIDTQSESDTQLLAKDTDIIVCFSGRIYNYHALLDKLPIAERVGREDQPARLIVSLYRNFREQFLEELNGQFAIAIWDARQNTLMLARDHLGIEPLYYYIDNKFFAFSSTARSITGLPGVEKRLNYDAVAKFLLFTYNPGNETFFKTIHRLPAAHWLTVSFGEQTLKRYWHISFEKSSERSQEDLSGQLLNHLTQAVRLRVDPEQPPAVFLSGGMDSSTVLALAHSAAGTDLDTYSYRCGMDSFDESPYARAMAAACDSHHHELSYTADDVLRVKDFMVQMNEPFCDVGINIATHILGREAGKRHQVVLTGDGGDELFGGHPIYEADKIAYYIDRLPRFLTAPLFSVLRQLPDSDQKKNLTVKAKRFAESWSLPSELLSHRWRIYYHPRELPKILLGEIYDSIKDSSALLLDILEINEQADGADLLSRSLYSDYHTAVDFYLRRNDLNRMYGLETRYPLLDKNLIEYCAKIPAKFKIAGWFDTKYIFKKAMEDVLPHDIIYRKDKLGHSIPLKNWMRENAVVRDFIQDHVYGGILNRTLLRRDFVEKMFREHMSKKSNHSHRLWALTVLEIWLSENF